ncbi:NADPH:quinone reductase [Jatrophihabitans fulvus]
MSEPQQSGTNTAVTYERTGAADVLHVVARPLTAPGPGEVRVRMHRAGVNPTDWKSRQGQADDTPVDPPQVPGQDGAGVVDAVGEGVEAALVGVRVWVWEAAYARAEGTAQQYATVPARQVVALPDSASFDLGAALGIPFLTAHRCLTVNEDGPRRLGPGTLQDRVVLVAGGAGAVGNAAIQLARWSDATVVATVSGPAKAQLAAAAGADHVVDYRRQDVAAELHRISARGADTIVEVAPAQNAGLDAAVLAPNGAVAMYANNGGDEFTLPVRALMGPNARWQFVLVYTVPAAAKAAAVDDVTSAVRHGAVRVGEEAGMPLHHFALERAADAHRAVEDGTTGKVLIDITD